ncbi:MULTISPECIES: DUF2194 domain-containing protein [unclassified Paenibacillus]|uniref:DUF2194 domain-containing protein n=1 Tax=unclassified Paenibacillus TaxID=185978 RepID=UPI001C122A8E|nr:MULTISPECIES: DUF2194 domain-containing protein [unclassified Paenibacillus]MBU5442408.1 DUF2194 domain-containing protein [Paenibacillus sp. MSJ-34]CAH0119444.1 hypothetical protein PAE9249_01947 [Paenibacillus sp. CECT 9249]
MGLQKKNIYFILALVLILGIALQISRQDELLAWTGRLQAKTPDSLDYRDAISPEEAASLQTDRILILYDDDNPYSIRLKDNIARTLKDMKQTADIMEAAKLQGSPDRYQAVIIAMPRLGRLTDHSWLAPYVEQGGHLLLATAPDLDDVLLAIYRKLGAYDVGEYILPQGVRFQTNILIGMKGYELNKDFITNSSLRMDLGDQANVHMTSAAGDPLLWETPYGKGKFVVFNGTMLDEKTSRGLITGITGLLIPDMLYSIFNVKLVYIDDFPAPFPNGINEELYRTYKRSEPRFFKEIWWPYMVRLAQKHNVKYTGVLIETYEDDVTPPFLTPKQADRSSLATLGREVLKGGGEIGLHGYNHQSFVTSERISAAFGYKPWASADDMAGSLGAALRFAQSVFPSNKIQTYVPPSNVLGPEGREILAKALPDLTNISSLYTVDEKQFAYVQEFEVAEDGIVELPRLTSGFLLEDYMYWVSMNGASSVGVFSHFVHPDDILDLKRSFPYTWEQLYERMDRFLQFQGERYGFLRSMTAAEAAVEVKKTAAAQVYVDRSEEGKLRGYVNRFSGDLYFLLRTDKKIGALKHCSVKRVDENVYLVQAKDAKFEIELKGSL